MGKKIMVRFQTFIVEHRLFIPQNWIFWIPEFSGTCIAIHWHFAFWSKRHCLVKQSFSVAILGLQNLFLFHVAGYSSISKGTFTLCPSCNAGAQALSSASLGLNLGVTSIGFLSTFCWILVWMSEIVQSPQYWCCFSTQTTKMNHKLDYLVFTAFDTDSRLIQNSVHCFLFITWT